MDRLHRQFACLAALTMFAAPASAERAEARPTIEAIGIPDGFQELAQTRQVLVDVYFGERKIAEARATLSDGRLTFDSPAELLAKVPGIIADPALASALAGGLALNSAAACGKSNAGDCGVITPDVIGIIYDESRFRVDLFVNPRFLATMRAEHGPAFLPVPDAPLSLTSAIGAAASGIVGEHSDYNVQNRTILAFHNARIRTSNSIASRLGWVVDDLVGEVDIRDRRYSGGLFWAPGDDFTGQRRILGAGFGTQFDTSPDRESLEGTPLILFLARPAQVEILVDGRLVSSRSYPAGNNQLDTSSLADGSYSVLLRIREDNGPLREEQRFFVKNARVAPIGHPVYFAYAGVLANTQAHQPVALSSDLYYHAAAAWRLNTKFAIDLGLLGTQRKAILEAGGWLVNPIARVRVAALVSSAGDTGALVQLVSSGHGPLNFSLDLRRIWSGDGEPLIPQTFYVNNFDGLPPTGVQLATGSFTQAVGSIGLRLGDAYLSIIGSYRKDRSAKPDYTVGPSVNWPVVTRNRFQLVLEASAQRTRTTTAGFAGFRMLVSSGPATLTGTLGYSADNDRERSGSARGRATGSIDAQYSAQTSGGAVLTGELGALRSIDSASLHAGGTLSSQLGNARIDLVHNVEGGGGTRYDVSLQSGLALSAHSALVGARQTDESAIVVAVSGDSPAAFRVLVDDSPRGEARAGQRLSLFLPPYRSYRIRLIPIDAAAVDFDANSRSVTLYPGNVETLRWDARSYFTLVAQAMSTDGKPIANRLVQSGKSIAETDESGYFQIDMRRDDPISIGEQGPQSCVIRLPSLAVHGDWASAGKVVCE